MDRLLYGYFHPVSRAGIYTRMSPPIQTCTGRHTQISTSLFKYLHRGLQLIFCSIKLSLFTSEKFVRGGQFLFMSNTMK